MPPQESAKAGQTSRQGEMLHHRRSIRLKGYNYAQAGAYFVTLCTWNHECLFGEIVETEVVMSEYGQVVVDEWLATPAIRCEIVSDAFVVMPNHLHAVVWIAIDDLAGTGAYFGATTNMSCTTTRTWSASAPTSPPTHSTGPRTRRTPLNAKRERQPHPDGKHAP